MRLKPIQNTPVTSDKGVVLEAIKSIKYDNVYRMGLE
jgi:hypothetical protein